MPWFFAIGTFTLFTNLFYMQKIMHENDLFESSDMSLVATLCCFGATIECVDNSSGPRAVFCMRREKGLDQLVQAFWARELKVDPMDYFNALKQCKTRLYDR